MGKCLTHKHNHAGACFIANPVDAWHPPTIEDCLAFFAWRVLCRGSSQNFPDGHSAEPGAQVRQLLHIICTFMLQNNDLLGGWSMYHAATSPPFFVCYALLMKINSAWTYVCTPQIEHELDIFFKASKTPHWKKLKNASFSTEKSCET